MSTPKNLNVLIVDDFEPMRKVTANQLRQLGIDRVQFAGNGVEALRILERHSIDMVLSDWNMPQMSGLELLRTIRSDEKLWKLPFIMITAEAERDRIREAIQQGVSDLLVKPYSPARLAASLEKAELWKARQSKRPTPSQNSAPAPAVASMPASARVLHATVAAPSELPSLLIVDDAPDNLHLLSQLFKERYRVRIAPNGEKALDICHSATPPDLILLDVMMPGMGGFEVARRIREHPNGEIVPIIFVTALDQEDARLQGMQLGAVDYVTKPINPEQLSLRVDNFMRFVKLHKQLQTDYDSMLEMQQIKDDVARITRHDIKGPLAGVIGILQDLQSDDTLNRRQQSHLRLAVDTTMQSINLINLTSELARIEDGSFSLKAKPVDLFALLQKLVELAREAFGSKGLTIVVDHDRALDEKVPPALGDELLCYSVFQNLIKNACEAAPEHSRVSVYLKTDAQPQVIISNTGAIPPEIRPHFFDKYVTLGKQGGTGLGTYSARLLTEAQHGQITFSVDELQNTSSLFVTLPAAAQNQ